jgi:hypothetical protein
VSGAEEPPFRWRAPPARRGGAAPRVYGVRARVGGRGQHGVGVEVALRRRGRADAVRLVRQGDVAARSGAGSGAGGGGRGRVGAGGSSGDCTLANFTTPEQVMPSLRAGGCGSWGGAPRAPTVPAGPPRKRPQPLGCRGASRSRARGTRSLLGWPAGVGRGARRGDGARRDPAWGAWPRDRMAGGSPTHARAGFSARGRSSPCDCTSTGPVPLRTTSSFAMAGGAGGEAAPLAARRCRSCCC